MTSNTLAKAAVQIAVLVLKLVLTRFHGHMRALGFRPGWGGVWGDYRQCMPAQRVRSSR